MILDISLAVQEDPIYWRESLVVLKRLPQEGNYFFYFSPQSNNKINLLKVWIFFFLNNTSQVCQTIGLLLLGTICVNSTQPLL